MSADWWQTFANNLAADLAPLISLLGDSPTKQYLSETLTFLDIFIFSMAPIGIITAIVSAIRVGGGPSLRAFVGRAQEGSGIAEAELCSSTSRDVCELYKNGSIARVFGRPKILEFVHDPRETEKEGAGICSFNGYSNHDSWDEVRTLKEDEENRSSASPDEFAPHPNLSLNVGIEKPSRRWFFLAATLGFILQVGVLVFAFLTSYTYSRSFTRVNTRIVVPAFELTCAGTILLCTGTGMCAFVIESSTHKRTFTRKNNQSQLYWIQPGNQVVGDQVFDSFAYSDANDPIEEYTTSWKTTKTNDRIQSLLVLAAVLVTSVGFVLQFLGLRALHPTVSVAQFSVMLLMTIIRASLRMRRMKKTSNLLGDLGPLSLRHELDWLAIELAKEVSTDDKASKNSYLPWLVTGFRNNQRKQSKHDKPTDEPTDKPLKIPRLVWLVTGSRSNQLQAFSAHTGRSSKKISDMYEKRVRLALITGAKTLNLRGSANTEAFKSPWDDSMIASREWALKLARAIENTMNTINNRCRVGDSWKTTNSISWIVACRMDDLKNTDWATGSVSLSIERESETNVLQRPWKVDPAKLEAILGVWLWSLISRSHNVTGHREEHCVTRASRVVSSLDSNSDSDTSELDPALELWLGPGSETLQAATMHPSAHQFHPGSVWVEKNSKSAYEEVKESEFPEGKCKSARRFFGSNIMSSQASWSRGKKLVDVFHIQSASSLEMLCAQELYSLFLSTVTSQIEELGGTDMIVEGASKEYVVNTTLSEMIDDFISSGIGDHSDAVACIVPVLHLEERLTYSSVFFTARMAAENMRNRGDWRKSEDALRSALNLALDGLDLEKDGISFSQPERTCERTLCLLSLCELYRRALWDDHANDFGLRGLIWLAERCSKYGDIPPELVICCDVALWKLSPGSKTDSLFKKALGRCFHREPIHDWDFHQALNKGQLKRVLYELGPEVHTTLTGMPVLLTAAKHGFNATFEDLNWLSGSTSNPSQSMIKHGWYTVMKSLREAGANAKCADYNGLKFLHYAAQDYNGSALRDLVRRDFDLLGTEDDLQRTPLHLAAASGNEDAVKWISKQLSVKVCSRDRFARSPRDHALLKDQPKTFLFLSNCEREAYAESTPTDIETKGLFHASCCGSVKIVKKLLKSVIKNSSGDRQERLQRCRQTFDDAGCLGVLRVLLDTGHDVNDHQSGGRTGLSFAIEAQNLELFEYLLKRKADTTIKDSRRKTCLHHAVISRCEHMVAKILTLSPSHLEAEDLDQVSPLAYAVKERDLKILPVMLRADPQKQNSALPGTAMALTQGVTNDRYRFYYQERNSEIRCKSSQERGQDAGRRVGVPATLYTPLAVSGTDSKHHVFYLAEGNILSASYYENGQWHGNILEGRNIRVETGSFIAACKCSDKIFVYYQDGRGCIMEVQASPKPSDQGVQEVVIATRGSKISAILSQTELSIYFQHSDSEIAKVSRPLLKSWPKRISKTTLVCDNNVAPRTAFALMEVLRPEEARLYWCDKEGSVRSGDYKKEIRCTFQLAAFFDGVHHMIFYQDRYHRLRCLKVDGREPRAMVVVK